MTDPIEPNPTDPPKSLITDPVDPDPNDPPEGDDPPKAPKPALEPITVDDLIIPEGAELNDEAATAFLEIMNNADLSPAERASALIDLQVKTGQSVAEKAAEAFQAEWDATQAKWQDETRALPEIGGDNLDKSLAQIKKGMMEAGASDDVFKILDESGLGNHPEFIKLMYALTKPLAEGPPISGSPPVGKLSAADKMYGRNK